MGKGGKETLTRKPHDFENPVRPQTEFADWRVMVALMAKRQVRQPNHICSFERDPHEHNKRVTFLNCLDRGILVVTFPHYHFSDL